jgi:hypothetical protein
MAAYKSKKDAYISSLTPEQREAIKETSEKKKKKRATKLKRKVRDV